MPAALAYNWAPEYNRNFPATGAFTYDSTLGVIVGASMGGVWYYNMGGSWIDITPPGYVCRTADVCGIYHEPTKTHFYFGMVSNQQLSKLQLAMRSRSVNG
jgi:hypothetical protein